MEELNLLEYIPINGKVSCAFADECELVKIDIEDRLPLVFKFRSVDGNYRLFYTTLSGKYSIFHPHPLIYPRKGVCTWENEPKLPNYDALEILLLSRKDYPYGFSVRIGNKEKGIAYTDGGLNKGLISDTWVDCSIIPKDNWTVEMEELRNNVIKRLKEEDNG